MSIQEVTSNLQSARYNAGKQREEKMTERFSYNLILEVFELISKCRSTLFWFNLMLLALQHSENASNLSCYTKMRCRHVITSG